MNTVWQRVPGIPTCLWEVGTGGSEVQACPWTSNKTIKQSVVSLRKSTGKEKTLSKLTKRQKGNIQINKVRNNRVFVSLKQGKKSKRK